MFHVAATEGGDIFTFDKSDTVNPIALCGEHSGPHEYIYGSMVGLAACCGVHVPNPDGSNSSIVTFESVEANPSVCRKCLAKVKAAT